MKPSLDFFRNCLLGSLRKSFRDSLQKVFHEFLLLELLLWVSSEITLEFPSELPLKDASETSPRIPQEKLQGFLGNSSINSSKPSYENYFRKSSTDFSRNAFGEPFRKSIVQNSSRNSSWISLEIFPQTPSKIPPKFPLEILHGIPS